MTRTVGQLIDDAARLLGETGAGAALDADTLAILFPIARDWLNGLAGHVTGTAEIMFDQAVGSATQLYGGNVRLFCTATCTVTLPTTPRPGWRVLIADVTGTLTLARNGKKIAGAAANATPTAGTEYFYRDDLGDWRSPIVAALADNVPWPDEFLREIAAMLAVELQSTLGLPLKFDTRAMASNGETRLVQRYFRKNPTLFKAWRYQAQPQPAQGSSGA